MKLKFYEIDSEYIKYLRENGDNKIPEIDYNKHKKFFCGIVLTINKFNYFAPVSSYNKKYQILLRKELHYCNINRENIRQQANQVYKLGLREETRKRFNICNFIKLEEKCLEFTNYKNKGY